MAIEKRFDVSFMAKLTAEEKQIQQNYRPVIGVHKWFARRPGSLFRGLLVAEFGDGGPLSVDYFQSHDFSDITIADPFMGGGTTLFEANRLGCNVLGVDINPMAYWVVRQELVSLDRERFRRQAAAVAADVEAEVDELYETKCEGCANAAPVKYFLWVKQQTCGGCGGVLDLFPGYLAASNARHTHFVLHCPGCRQLVQVQQLPAKGKQVSCPECAEAFDWRQGSASKNRYSCECGHVGKYPVELREEGPPKHRLFGLEYHCKHCRPEHRGRWFKTADAADLERFETAARRLAAEDLFAPDDDIPDGDETKRLHRWGYSKYREMFNARQLLSLGLLVRRIRAVAGDEERHGLATVFSDFLRYQNMLCRYDTYALKCQDIFSVHGFPVGLVQCENNVLGIPRVGSGAFRHFVEKYDRAKAYCEAPFETLKNGSRKKVFLVHGERINATLVSRPAKVRGRHKAFLGAQSIEDLDLRPGTLDGVFTDPPYFDNVQYAELMDFCYAWLRPFLAEEVAEFRNGKSTRSMKELTGNVTLGRDVEHFTEGLARVFSRAARGLKLGAPFVFTYHHNDVEAYVSIVVAMLDANLSCTATLPSPAEMTASLHINGTRSSVVDSVFVCRRRNGDGKVSRMGKATLQRLLQQDRTLLLGGGIECSRGDIYCLGLGHLARTCVERLAEEWSPKLGIARKIKVVDERLRALMRRCNFDGTVSGAIDARLKEAELARSSETLQVSLFNKLTHTRHGEDLPAGR